jgi:hypothetical protein
MHLLRTISAHLSGIIVLVCLAGCAPGETDDDDERVGELEEAAGSGTVGHALATSCTTGSVKGLSSDHRRGKCIVPDAYVKVPDLGNVSFAPPSSRTWRSPRRAACGDAQRQQGQEHVRGVDVRTVAQQYLLHWFKDKRCDIGLAAEPGDSNHETGLAMA